MIVAHIAFTEIESQREAEEKLAAKRARKQNLIKKLEDAEERLKEGNQEAMLVERYNGDGAVAVIPVISEFPSVVSSEVSNAMSKIRDDTVGQNRIFIEEVTDNIKDLKKKSV